MILSYYSTGAARAQGLRLGYKDADQRVVRRSTLCLRPVSLKAAIRIKIAPRVASFMQEVYRFEWSRTFTDRRQSCHKPGLLRWTRLCLQAEAVAIQGLAVKLISCFFIAAYLLIGCTSTPSTDSTDAPGPTGAGPALCHDGTPPPCTIRQ